jgi:hypothetical protein
MTAYVAESATYMCVYAGDDPVNNADPSGQESFSVNCDAGPGRCGEADFNESFNSTDGEWTGEFGYTAPTPYDILEVAWDLQVFVDNDGASVGSRGVTALSPAKCLLESVVGMCKPGSWSTDLDLYNTESGTTSPPGPGLTLALTGECHNDVALDSAGVSTSGVSGIGNFVLQASLGYSRPSFEKGKVAVTTVFVSGISTFAFGSAEITSPGITV